MQEVCVRPQSSQPQWRYLPVLRLLPHRTQRGDDCRSLCGGVQHAHTTCGGELLKPPQFDFASH
jgi:hypothetical protein